MLESLFGQEVTVPAITIDDEGLLERLGEVTAFLHIYINQFHLTVMLQFQRNMPADPAATEDHDALCLNVLLPGELHQVRDTVTGRDHECQVALLKLLLAAGDNSLLMPLDCHGTVLYVSQRVGHLLKGAVKHRCILFQLLDIK